MLPALLRRLGNDDSHDIAMLRGLTWRREHVRMPTPGFHMQNLDRLLNQNPQSTMTIRNFHESSAREKWPAMLLDICSERIAKK